MLLFLATVPIGALYGETALNEPLAIASWPWIALLIGLVVGSFGNVCIHRLPLRQSIVTPRSRCPRCGAPIRALDNVPLLSYAVLRGRCRSCRAPISARYPAVEAANGLLYLGLARSLGPTLQAAVAMALVTALLALTLIDLDHQLLPDVITLPGIVVGLAASFLPGPPTPLSSLAAAVGGYLVLAAFAWTWRRLRGMEAMGQGDWKMTAMLGAFLGVEKLLLTVLLATVCGSLVGVGQMVFAGRSSQHKLPLGTFLGLAGILVVVAGPAADALLDWYKGLLGG
jgi:leader peptidase (prepilin peptidase)/N-methyltransferase